MGRRIATRAEMLSGVVRDGLGKEYPSMEAFDDASVARDDAVTRAAAETAKKERVLELVELFKDGNLSHIDLVRAIKNIYKF